MASFMLSNRHDAMFYGHCTTLNELEVFSNINWDNFDKGTFASSVLYSPSPFRASRVDIVNNFYRCSGGIHQPNIGTE